MDHSPVTKDKGPNRPHVLPAPHVLNVSGHRRGRWGMFPMMGPEMLKARVEELRREGEARARSAGGATPVRRVGLRAALGVCPVSVGNHPLPEPAPTERAPGR